MNALTRRQYLIRVFILPAVRLGSLAGYFVVALALFALVKLFRDGTIASVAQGAGLIAGAFLVFAVFGWIWDHIAKAIEASSSDFRRFIGILGRIMEMSGFMALGAYLYHRWESSNDLIPLLIALTPALVMSAVRKSKPRQDNAEPILSRATSTPQKKTSLRERPD